MTDLKCCPFCGSPAKLKNTAGSYGYYPDRVGVMCSKCWCSGVSFDCEEYIPGKGMVPVDAKSQAIEAWNTRADLVPQWHPIETAPRDGRAIIVWARWGWADMDEESADGYDARIARWCDDAFMSITSNPYFDVAYDPTHWMPLAEPN